MSTWARWSLQLAYLFGLALVGCTKPNPAVCCLDTADCKEVGLGEVRDCNPGLACVEHQCEVPSCSMTGCEAATPVCNITTDVCEGCTDSSQCSKFNDTQVCDTATGACVECVTASDCSAALPICDASACRGCKLDSECASGACGDDGACVAESAIVYVDPGGSDTGTCTRSAPCQKIVFAVSRTTTTRTHLVLAQGAYVEAAINISAQNTSASSLYIHGGGATITYPSTGDSSQLISSLGLTIRDLTFNASFGSSALDLSASTFVLERVTIRGAANGLEVRSLVTAHDLQIQDCSHGIYVHASGQLVLEGGVISGGDTAIFSNEFGNTVQITNLLAYGTSGLAIDLPNTSGTIASSTIADSGTDTGTGPRAVRCSNTMTTRASIIWAPGTTSRVAIDGCNLISTIAGPTFTPGASNSDPVFVDRVGHDYHLAPSSPARDGVDTGPASDFEGDARPQGARFDIGADEAK